MNVPEWGTGCGEVEAFSGYSKPIPDSGVDADLHIGMGVQEIKKRREYGMIKTVTSLVVAGALAIGFGSGAPAASVNASANGTANSTLGSMAAHTGLNGTAQSTTNKTINSTK